MTTLNFSGRFADLVASGTKRQTIRADKHGRLGVGRQLQLYTGLRTKNPRKLTDQDPVVVENVYVAVRPDYLTLGGPGYPKIDFDAFAMMDGFNSYAEMVGWFQDTYKQPSFIGRCIRWDFLERAIREAA
jgi:hypothetical protein